VRPVRVPDLLRGGIPHVAQVCVGSQKIVCYRRSVLLYVIICTFAHPTRVTRTGWRRPIGCLELHVIFRKRATYYRALLRKMTCEDTAPYRSSPTCMCPCLLAKNFTRRTGVCRVSESQYPTARYRMYILTPYTPTQGRHARRRLQQKID